MTLNAARGQSVRVQLIQLDLVSQPHHNIIPMRTIMAVCKRICIDFIVTSV